MSNKEWGKQCDSGVGLCFNGSPTTWCSGQQPCIGGDVGDLGILDIPKDELQKTLDASTTKFVLDDKGRFIEVGIFIAAGCMAGDKLIGIIQRDGFYAYDEPNDKSDTLTWQFITKRVTVLFERGDEKLWATMPNPIFS